MIKIILGYVILGSILLTGLTAIILAIIHASKELRAEKKHYDNQKINV